MLEMSCVEFWRYSNITCCGYPLGNKYIYINFCVLLVCTIITHEPIHRIASSFDLGTRENHGNVPSLVLRELTLKFSFLVGVDC